MPDTSIFNVAKYLKPIAEHTGLDLSFVAEKTWVLVGFACWGVYHVFKYIRKKVKKVVVERTVEEKRSAEAALLALRDLRKEVDHLLKGMPGLKAGEGEKKFEELEDKRQKLNITLTTIFDAPEVIFSPALVFRIGYAKRRVSGLKWGSHAHELPSQERQRQKEIYKADSDHKIAVNEIQATFNNAESAVRAYIEARDS